MHNFLKRLPVNIRKSTTALFIAMFACVLLLQTVTAQAQQPTTAPQPSPTGTPGTTTPTTMPPGLDPATLTPEQIKQLSDQQNNNVDNATKDDNNKEDQTDDEGQEENSDDPDKTKKKQAVGDDAGRLPIFGNDVFANNFSTSTSANRPTPVNYVLGPGDRLSIDVTGNSVVSWDLAISPEGAILLPGMGRLYIGGSTIENATEAIKGRLRQHNFAIGRGTDVAVTLSNIRSIRVSIIGQVRRPGNYSVSSLTTVFNALYESGGISSNGSFRNIELIRDNQLYATIDVYDYLLRGDLSSNYLLKDDDVIRVPEYKTRVSIEGQVKRSAYFEMKPGESLSELIRFAGGFTDQAYTNLIKITQVTDKQYRVKNVGVEDFDNYIPLKGDQFFVSPILDRFENRIVIKGAVFRPGAFELESSPTLKTLIERADGLKEDAYPERGYITRLNEDNSMSVIPFFVKGVMDGTSPDIALQREDIVTIPSIFELAESFGVSIRGAVRSPGDFAYNAGMTVEDLIVLANGFTDGANMQRIEISRRVRDSDRRKKDAKLAEIITIDVDPQLRLSESKFKLEPYDIVSVYMMPGFVKPQIVRIEGEVMRPGFYTMIRKDERLSDLIKRVDGFTEFAYLKGATYQRGDYVETRTDKRIAQLKREQMAQEQLEATDGKTSRLDLNSQVERNNFVAIDFEYAIKHPGSSQDLILMDGDIINIPRELQTVKISGEVLWPTTAVYRPGMTAKDYILEYSGGFAESASKKNVNVILASGQTKATRSYLFSRKYPAVEPGAEIFVPYKPKKKEREPMPAQAWIGLGTSMASLAAIIFGIINVSKN
jgi:protein involved in polysaccharide export with SLBB domain